MTSKQYFQCNLRRGDSWTTAWIEERGAKVGSSVEILPAKELWEVCQVFQPGMPETMLKEHQLLNRRSLPSIEAIK